MLKYALYAKICISMNMQKYAKKNMQKYAKSRKKCENGGEKKYNGN